MYFFKKDNTIFSKKWFSRKNVYKKLIRSRNIYGKEYKNDFLDMGSISNLKKLPKFLDKIFFKPCLFLDRDGVI